MGLLMPLLLGGLALVGLPWFIHRVRRPSNNPTPFSSLMFLPKTVPPLRARKRIEHPWLMALRMLALVLLALAYARPYLLVRADAVPSATSKRQHVLLVDTSLSTTAGGQFEKTMEAAQACLAALGSDPVAIVTFNENAEVIAPLGAPDAASALARVVPTHGATDVLAGLRMAEEVLRLPSKPTVGEGREESIIHLVSDLQRTGLPDDATAFSLARSLSLKLIPVAPLPPGNTAVEAMVLEARAPSTLVARARLRNYGSERIDGTLEFWLNEVLAASQPVSLQADGGVNLSLSAQSDLGHTARVEMRLAVADSMEEDNHRYAVFNPEPVRAIGVAIDATADRSQPIPFLEAALAESQPVPWQWTPVEPAALAEVEAPVLVLPGPSTMTVDEAEKIVAYVDGGGGLLVVPSHAGFPEALNAGLLRPSGLEVSTAKFDAIDPSRYALLSWIDYDDPAFQAFRSAAYSDFSMLRFNNYYSLAVDPNAAIQVAARLEAPGETSPDPAMVTFKRGAGRVAVWAFPLEPDWTNITRTRRFVPLLHETVALLLPPLAPLREHIACEAISAPPALSVDGLRLRAPGDGEARPFALESKPGGGFIHGFYAWSSATGPEPEVVEAVNLRPKESDLGSLSAEEFLLRIGAASEGVVSGPNPANVPIVVHWEYGYPVLILLAVACLLESALAVFCSRPVAVEQRQP